MTPGNTSHGNRQKGCEEYPDQHANRGATEGPEERQVFRQILIVQRYYYYSRVPSTYVKGKGIRCPLL